ncbi:MAG: hypothetical protein R2695_01250 [Acidimicrobiales bacterium]
MMFQEPTLFPHRTVGQNVEFDLHSIPAAQALASRRDVAARGALRAGPATRPRPVVGGEARRRRPRPCVGATAPDPPRRAARRADRVRREQLVDDLPAAVLRAGGDRRPYVTHDHDEAFKLGRSDRSDGRGSHPSAVASPGPSPRRSSHRVRRPGFLGQTNIVGPAGGAG